MTKRVLAMLMAIILCVSMLPFTAVAEESAGWQEGDEAPVTQVREQPETAV